MKKLIGTLAAFSILTLCFTGLTACKSTKEYSVICQNADNGRVIVADESVKAGDKVILAAKPDIGYRLTSFVLDGEVLDGCSFTMPKKYVTVSATFEIVTYSITYVLGDTVFTGNNPETYTVESATELNAPQKDGYEICGWYTYHNQSEYEWDMEDYRVTSLEGLFGDLTLYAKYYNPPHVINVIDGENGWCYVENYYEAFYGEIYTVDVNPNNGYYLESLFLNGAPIEGTSFTMPAGDVEITSVFKPIVYEISYELFGGKNSEDNPATFTVEDGYITLSDPTKEGYIFEGWYLDEEFSVYFYPEIDPYYWLDQPLTLYARFIEEY